MTKDATDMREKCAGCLIWQYKGSYLDRPEGQRMDGWCRHLNRVTRQDYYCEAYTDKAKQEAEYLACVRAGQG